MCKFLRVGRTKVPHVYASDQTQFFYVKRLKQPTSGCLIAGFCQMLKQFSM